MDIPFLSFGIVEALDKQRSVLKRSKWREDTAEIDVAAGAWGRP
jgi:hypothetical protein